jgi:hypothetical protein
VGRGKREATKEIADVRRSATSNGEERGAAELKANYGN